MGSILIFVGIIAVGVMLYRAIRAATFVLYEGMIRLAMVSNFSRFGDISDTTIAVIDDERGYFLREGALWLVKLDGDTPVHASARPVDLMKVDRELLREAMMAVDALNSDMDDEEDDE